MVKTLSGYTQHDEEIEVPSNVGVEGFLSIIRQVLRLPRLQEVHVDARGKITYSFFLREGEHAKALPLNFETLMPYAVVRNSTLEEVVTREVNAAVVLVQMFRRAGIDHVFPTTFVTGVGTALWGWYERTTGLAAEVRDELLGLPVLEDRACPDDVLLLCAAYTRGAELSATQKVYKVALPQGVL